MSKIKIELTPYTAMCIYKFLSEFESDMDREPQLKAFKKSYKEFETEVITKITDEQLTDAIMQTQINQALGDDPKTQ